MCRECGQSPITSKQAVRGLLLLCSYSKVEKQLTNTLVGKPAVGITAEPVHANQSQHCLLSIVRHTQSEQGCSALWRPCQHKRMMLLILFNLSQHQCSTTPHPLQLTSSDPHHGVAQGVGRVRFTIVYYKRLANNIVNIIGLCCTNTRQAAGYALADTETRQGPNFNFQLDHTKGPKTIGVWKRTLRVADSSRGVATSAVAWASTATEWIWLRLLLTSSMTVMPAVRCPRRKLCHTVRARSAVLMGGLEHGRSHTAPLRQTHH